MLALCMLHIKNHDRGDWMGEQIEFYCVSQGKKRQNGPVYGNNLQTDRGFGSCWVYDAS
jgi:hypothetical protein